MHTPLTWSLSSWILLRSLNNLGDPFISALGTGRLSGLDATQRRRATSRRFKITAMPLYSSGAPPPVADHTQGFYTAFEHDFNTSLYPAWLLEQNFNFIDPPFFNSEVQVQQSPTNTASTTHSTHSTRSSGFSTWDEGGLGHGRNGCTASGSSRTSDSGCSGGSRKSEKRKREKFEEQGSGPHPGSGMPQTSSAGPPHIAKRGPTSRRPPHNPYQ